MNTTVYPYGQLGQPVPAGHGYTAVQGYTVPGHHFVQLGGPNINGVTASPRPAIQALYASGKISEADPFILLKVFFWMRSLEWYIFPNDVIHTKV